MKITSSNNRFKAALTLMGLFLGISSSYGNLPGELVIDNESSFDIAITADIFVGNGQHFEYSSDQIKARDSNVSITADKGIKKGPDGEDNIKININNWESTINQPLSAQGTSKYVIEENGERVGLLVSVVDANREYGKNENLTGFYYHVLVQDVPNFEENDPNIIYVRNGYEYYDYNGNLIRDTGYGVGGAAEGVGRGVGNVIEGVGNAIGNIFN